MHDTKAVVFQAKLLDHCGVGIEHLVDRTVADGMGLQLPACSGSK